MTWTNVAKPTGTPYTVVNPQGKEQYDQASLTYDDATTYYDGVNQLAYTNVAKPADTSSSTIRVGMATGLIMPPTYSTAKTVTIDKWTRVSKPT